MRSEAKKKMLLAAAVAVLALALPVALAVVGGMKLWEETRDRPESAPDTSGLREAAERAAQAALPVPTLASDAEILRCAPDELEAQVQRVVRLAGGVGGVASSWNDGKTLRIIAKIPTDTESLFRDAVARGLYDMRVAHGAQTTTVVEVLIEPGVASAPAKAGD